MASPSPDHGSTSFDLDQPVLHTHTIMLSPIRKVATPRSSSQSAPRKPKKIGKLSPTSLHNTSPQINRKIIFNSPHHTRSTNNETLNLQQTPIPSNSILSSSRSIRVFQYPGKSSAGDTDTVVLQLTIGEATPVPPPNTPQDQSPHQPNSGVDIFSSAGNRFADGINTMFPANLKRRRSVHDDDGKDFFALPDNNFAQLSNSSSSTIAIFEDSTAQAKTTNPWALRDKQGTPKQHWEASSAILDYSPIRDGRTSPVPSTTGTPTRTALSENIIKSWVVDDSFQEDEALWGILDDFGPAEHHHLAMSDTTNRLRFSTPDKPGRCSPDEISPLSLPRSIISDKENIDPMLANQHSRRTSLPLQPAFSFKKRRTTTMEPTMEPVKPLSERQHSETYRGAPRELSAVGLFSRRRSMPDFGVKQNVGIMLPFHAEQGVVMPRTVLGQLGGFEEERSGFALQAQGFKFQGVAQAWNEDDEMLM